MQFQKAERKRSKLRLALCGPSGSGKTYSALLIASGLAGSGRVAMLDTERGSGALYADVAGFDVAMLPPPFETGKYIAGIEAAERAGYSVLIIDSLSHAWAGEGGILDMHDKAQAASRGGNIYTAWRNVTPQHNALVDAILCSGLHVIVTMRTKTAYELVVDEGGKKKPVKIGMAPVQREGMEYEFTLVLDLSVDKHIATVSKDRTRLFDGKHWVPDVKTGERLRAWLDGVSQEVEAAIPMYQSPAPAPAPAPAPETMDDSQRDKPRISKDALDRQFERMRPAIESGSRTAKQAIDALQTKYFLTDYDKKRFLDIPVNGGQ